MINVVEQLLRVTQALRENALATATSASVAAAAYVAVEKALTYAENMLDKAFLQYEQAEFIGPFALWAIENANIKEAMGIIVAAYLAVAAYRVARAQRMARAADTGEGA